MEHDVQVHGYMDCMGTWIVEIEDVSGCQNYVPFVGPCYNTAPNM